MIVADTGAMVALIDADDRHHALVRGLFEESSREWILPWAILPEVDYLLAAHVGRAAENAFIDDLAAGMFRVAWGDETDLMRAKTLCKKYPKLGLGLVDGVVIATAERLEASAIATFDLRHLGTVRIEGRPRILPRDV